MEVVCPSLQSCATSGLSGWLSSASAQFPCGIDVHWLCSFVFKVEGLIDGTVGLELTLDEPEDLRQCFSSKPMCLARAAMQRRVATKTLGGDVSHQLSYHSKERRW